MFYLKKKCFILNLHCAAWQLISTKLEKKPTPESGNQIIVQVLTLLLKILWPSMAGVIDKGDMKLRVIVLPNCLAFCCSLDATALVHFPYKVFTHPPKKNRPFFLSPHFLGGGWFRPYAGGKGSIPGSSRVTPDYMYLVPGMENQTSRSSKCLSSGTVPS